jgi:hypothetical protein
MAEYTLDFYIVNNIFSDLQILFQTLAGRQGMPVETPETAAAIHS